ncbi:MAG: DNRLRE domain-containing protein, partial [Ginsengibacter sp.]
MKKIYFFILNTHPLQFLKVFAFVFFIICYTPVSAQRGKTKAKLVFTPNSLSFSVIQNSVTANKTSVLSANSGTPTNINLSKSSNSNWLTLPASALGSLSFGINSAGLVPGTYTSIVTAASSGYNNATLQVTLTVSLPTISIFFTHSTDSSEVSQGGVGSLLEYIATSDNTPANVQLSALDGSGNLPAWLSVNGMSLNGINYTTGSEITFDFDATTLSLGTYSATVTASAAGYNSAVLNIFLTVKAGSSGTLSNIRVNFQDSVSVPPSGWLRDYGQSFGQRLSSYQGSGNVYGWIKRSDNTPVDLRKNGRKRSTPSDILLATLMHMQAGDAPGSSLTSTEGIWETQVANGNYDVTVSAGDGSYTNSNHTINVEGVSAISNFVPTTSQLFTSATVTVSVADGLLTIDAIGGVNTKINYVIIKPSASRRPSVVLVNPDNGSQQVSENTSISTSILDLPNGGIDNSTLTSATVYLTEEGTGTVVASNVNGTGGGDAITLVPSVPLKLSTTYNFNITDVVKDLSGASFIPYASNFITGSGSSGGLANVRFDKIALPNTTGRHSSLTMGPDGKLYALSIDGLIKRFPVNNDGTLGAPDTLYSLQDEYGVRQQRLAIGFTFDPSATATNLVAWVTHSTFVFLNGASWDGKLTRLSGNNLQNVQDVLVNLPRSAKDHLTNSISFGPDGKLYFTQGSTSAMGRADNTWSNRNECLLSGAVLRLDVSKLGSLPLNVKTSDGGGTYNPYAANAPLTIHASGVRNAYDLVWHSNGSLYVPTNGSAAGGNTPASVAGTVRPDGSNYNGPVIPALTNVLQTQKDFLFRVVPGGYYGHPNPLRGEYVMNGGNPSTSIDPAQVNDYPVGTLPDANWRGNAFDFQNNKSPDGAIEYKSNTFNGDLKGKLLVVRYSQNDDIITLTPGGTNNDIVSSTEGAYIEGFSGFIDPLDLTEDTLTGNLYVSEYGGNGRITLLRPKIDTIAAGPAVVLGALADASVRNGTYADKNYGSDTALLVKTSPNVGFTRVTYLKFSLSSVSKVSSAKLRVYGRNTTNSTGVTLSCYGADTDSWMENTLTWNNAPATQLGAL